MAKLNQGDVIEGIFTIALALYIANQKIDKNQLNKIRTKIDSKMFSTGRVSYSIAKNVKRQSGKKPPDYFNVDFQMRLKPESVPGAFGKDYDVLYRSGKEIPKIDRKINQLISSVNTANFTRKVDTAIMKFLSNNHGEVVDFTVVADGIAGESSGGDIKGDVTLQIYATRKKVKQKILSESIAFSLKSESVTVANLSPYKGMLDIASGLGIKWNAKEKYIRLSKPFTGPVEQKAKDKLIKSMYSDLQKEILKISKSPNFTNSAYAFLGKSIFGKDKAEVIDVTQRGVKEITIENFNRLKRTTVLEPQVRGNNLFFVDKKTKKPIFKLRTKLRVGEAKFYLEVAPGIYAK